MWVPSSENTFEIYISLVIFCRCELLQMKVISVIAFRSKIGKSRVTAGNIQCLDMSKYNLLVDFSFRRSLRIIEISILTSTWFRIFVKYSKNWIETFNYNQTWRIIFSWVFFLHRLKDTVSRPYNEPKTFNGIFITADTKLSLGYWSYYNIVMSYWNNGPCLVFGLFAKQTTVFIAIINQIGHLNEVHCIWRMLLPVWLISWWRNVAMSL